MLTLHCYLRFRSSYGQTFFILGNIPELGGGDPAKAVPLSYLNDEFWYGSIELENIPDQFQYQYLIRHTDGIETMEFIRDRIIEPAKIKTEAIQLIDTWNYAGEFENAFYTQPFTDSLFKSNELATAKQTLDIPENTTHIFRVKAPLITQDETLCVLGSCAELGAWATEKAKPMVKSGNWFTLPIDLGRAPFPIAYKYGIWNKSGRRFSRFETGANRYVGGTGRNQVSVLNDGFAHLPNTTFKGAGVAIPVFSLRSSQGFGVGEFNDLKGLVDWGRKAGLKLLQILPINDTVATHTWVDSYPYAAISAFALHPQYINLEKMAGEEHLSCLEPFKALKEELNQLPEIDYERMMEAKLSAIQQIFGLKKKQWQKDADYKAWFETNQHWLKAYAVFCYLRDANNTSDFSAWPSHNQYDPKDFDKLISPKSDTHDKLAVHLFTQYHLHLQLKEAVDYAHQNGLIMKGDIPIGIYRNSCDAWVQPELYNMDEQAGAPPDDFAIKGQNWGFPTYNWHQMQQDGFKWWKQRFSQMSLYFDAFRIDHILGFFRIWSIPMHAVQGIMGHFSPSIPISINEFAEKGIWFNYERYCHPYITDQLLHEMFADKAGMVKEEFLQDKGWQLLGFKEHYNTQRKIKAWFDQNPGVDKDYQEKLFDLISNVILLPNTEANADENLSFHFRIAMDTTTSFQYLDDHIKNQLKELYVNYFFRRQDDFWRREALKKLPALKASTNMLICGEDLGMVPDCVPGVMKDLGLLSLEIQRMPKDPTTTFFRPAEAPYLSVVTPSTHDMSTVRGWWEENRELTQQFYNNEMGQWGEAPYYCEPWIAKMILQQHIYSPAMWSIFQIQDILAMDGRLRRENPEDERINVPANPQHYWRYRMHISLENLIKERTFTSELKVMLTQAGRV